MIDYLIPKVKSSTEVLCEWDPVSLKSKLNLRYILYKGKLSFCPN